MPYSWDNVVLVLAQAVLVALPGAGLPPWLERLRGRGWALLAPASIVVFVVVVSVLPGAADVLTWFALLAVPLGAALALVWAAHGARLAGGGVLAVGLLVAALTLVGTRDGQAAALALTALSCVTVGRLLAGGAPTPLLRAGIVAMAVIDAVLVFSGGLEKSNTAYLVAAPGPGLPQLQFVGFGGASMGYGDVFVAGVLGGVLAAEGVRLRAQVLAAAAVAVCALLFDCLFAVTDTLPATVPVAVVTLATGGRAMRSRLACLCSAIRSPTGTGAASATSASR